MSKLRRHALLANLIEEMRGAKSWTGRTHIQKTLYVFQSFFDAEPDLRVPYLLYRHGPYSFGLDEDLAEMEFYGAIRREEHPPYGPRYELTGEAGVLRARYGAGLDDWLPALRFVAGRVATRPVRELEALCTLMHVATDSEESGRCPHVEAQIARVRELKPHLTDAELHLAAAEYSALREDARALATPDRSLSTPR